MQPVTVAIDSVKTKGAYVFLVVTCVTELAVELAFLYIARQRDIRQRQTFLQSKRLLDADLDATVEVNAFRVSSLQRWFVGTTETESDTNSDTITMDENGAGDIEMGVVGSADVDDLGVLWPAADSNSSSGSDSRSRESSVHVTARKSINRRVSGASRTSQVSSRDTASRMTSRNTGQTSSTQDASRATGRFKRQTSQNLIES